MKHASLRIWFAVAVAVISAAIADPLVEAEFRIPQSEGRVIAALERGATLSGQRFVGNLLYVHAVGPASLLNRYRRYQLRDEEGIPKELAEAGNLV